MDFDPPILAPSILAADYTQLGNQIDTCLQAGLKWIHCDIMDGHFVPNISYGPVIVEAANRNDDVFLDVHLMIENPDYYVEPFVEAGADLLTVHQEACPHLHRTIQHIKEHQIQVGVAVNPATPLQAIVPILHEVDLILIMSVNPGFGGQSFIESSYEKIKELYLLRQQRNNDFLIEIDGGAGLKNIQKITASGADVLVAGSSVFKTDNIPQRIEELTIKAKKGTRTYV